MTDARRPGEWAQSAARRREILEAARQSFLQRGLEGASLRDIATRAGMTHAGLLHHFANKDELLLAVLEQRDQEEGRRYSGACPDASDAGLVRSLGALMLEHQKDPEWMRLWAELTAAAARPEHTAHAYFVQRYATVHDLMTSHLEHLLAQGALRQDVSPQVAASLLAAVMDGLQTQWLLDRECRVVEALDELLRLLTRPGATWAGPEDPQPHAVEPLAPTRR